MAFNFTKSEAALIEIAQRTERNRRQLVALQQQAIDIENALAAMPTEYSGISGEINSEATAQPGDEAIQDLKRKKDKLASDFQALKTTATSINVALAAFDLS